MQRNQNRGVAMDLTLRPILFAGMLTLVGAAVIGQAATQHLPGAVRLMVRPKKGDAYAYKNFMKLKMDYSFISSGGTVLKSGSYVETERTEDTRAVQSVDASGRVTFSIHILSDTQTMTQDGKPQTSPGPLSTITEVVAPNGQQLSKTVAASKDKADAPDDSTSQSALLFTFPDDVVRVGGEWRGIVHTLGKDDSGDLPFTGKLEAIEMRQDTPCAHISYQPDLSKMLDRQFLKMLPDGTKPAGDAKTTGSYTCYYALDRGMVVDTDGNMVAAASYTLPPRSVGGTSPGVLKAALSITFNEKVTQMPAYDPKLVVAR